jgi:hypothetical protein
MRELRLVMAFTLAINALRSPPEEPLARQGDDGFHFFPEFFLAANKSSLFNAQVVHDKPQ